MVQVNFPLNNSPKEIDDMKKEMLRFVKSYMFSTGKRPQVSIVKRYTSMRYPKLIQFILRNLEKEKKILVRTEHQGHEIILLD